MQGYSTSFSQVPDTKDENSFSADRKKGFHRNLERVYALHVAQADNEFPPQGVWRCKVSTPKVRMWTAVPIYRSGGPDVDRSSPVE